MDKYEISLWEDYSDETSDSKKFLNERKIAVIGSDTMEAQARALEPNLVEEINGIILTQIIKLVKSMRILLVSI